MSSNCWLSGLNQPSERLSRVDLQDETDNLSFSAADIEIKSMLYIKASTDLSSPSHYEYQSNHSQTRFKKLVFKTSLQCWPRYLFFHVDNRQRGRIRMEKRLQNMSYLETKEGETEAMWTLLCGVVLYKDNQRYYARLIEGKEVKIDPKINQPKSQEKIFIVSRYFNSLGGYPLKKGLELKLGNALFEVLGIKLNKGDPDLYIEALMFSQKQLYLNLDLKQEQKQASNEPLRCKFCFSGDKEGNPLINPCKCKGSTGYVHIKCLGDWLELRKKMKRNKHCSCYLLSQNTCEICLQPFPRLICKRNQLYSTYTFQPEPNPHVVLLRKDKNLQQVCIVRVASETATPFGAFDLLSPNASVAPMNEIHSMISCKPPGKEYRIFDNHSRFGTLIRERVSTVIELNEHIKGIQIGNMLLSFRIEIIKPLEQAYRFMSEDLK